MTATNPLLEQEQQLTDYANELELDPLGYGLGAYEWGKPGTILENEKLRAWQAEDLDYIGTELRTMASGAKRWMPIRMSTVSGHGSGKSAEVGIVTDWALNTLVDTRVIITANTDGQLQTKTMPEVMKWNRLSIFSERWHRAARSITSLDKEHRENWRVDAIPWSKDNSDAFQGAHNKGVRLLMIFDEASGIHDKIWEVTEGALLAEDTQILWLVYGNGTRSKGRFRRTQKRERKLWRCRSIDVRDVEGVSKDVANAIIDTHGEDSDIARIRVRGMFPKASGLQFISENTVIEAQAREALSSRSDPLVVGVDVSRGGLAMTVAHARRGFDAKSIPPFRTDKTDDYFELVGDLAAWSEKKDIFPWPVDHWFIDMGGVGAGVVDIAKKRFGDSRVTGVYFQKKCPRPDLYANMRMYMWAMGKAWLEAGGALYDSKYLLDDLTAPDVHEDGQGRKIMDSKEKLIKDGEGTLDDGDGFLLTFAAQVDQSWVQMSADQKKPRYVNGLIRHSGHENQDSLRRRKGFVRLKRRW